MSPLLEWARESQRRVAEGIRDYTCVMVKRERVDGELRGRQAMFAKVRHRQMHEGEIITPLSIYLKFLAPADVRGTSPLPRNAPSIKKRIDVH